jgi:hypothetical protein
MLAALQAIFDAKISDYIEIFLTSKSKEKPQPGSGGTGAGASIFRDGYATEVLALRTVPAAVCFRYHLGRRCEADVG